MVKQMIILQGGEDVRKRTNESLIKKIGEISISKRILVIPWSGESDQKEKEYRTIFCNYFSDNGFQETLFLEKNDMNDVIDRKFDSVDVIYLPGGDTGILYKELEKHSLQHRLMKFNGLILGNSAGAIVLTRGTWMEGIFYPGFGIVDFYISVHYIPESDQLAEIDSTLKINIPENMWITVTP